MLVETSRKQIIDAYNILNNIQKRLFPEMSGQSLFKLYKFLNLSMSKQKLKVCLFFLSTSYFFSQLKSYCIDS